MDDEQLNEDLFIRENVLAEAALAAHKDDPLNAELRCYIQPYTLKRLREYCDELGFSMDSAINTFLKSMLYDQGY